MKVIDAILFCGELDMLELRLNELNSVVDAFCIVEAAEMHGSAKKREPSFIDHFRRDEPWLRPFRSKIYYNVLWELNPAYTDGQSGWARENFHRNSLMAPVLDASTSKDDIVIVSDADEIPRARAIKRYIDNRPPGVALLRLDHYFYNVNCYGGVWMRSSIGTLRDYEAMGGFQAPRGHLGDVIERQVIAVGNAGWHFSSFFDIPRLREKLENFAHSFELGPLLELTDAELTDLIRQRVNIFKGEPLARRPTKNPTLPAYFLDNLKRFEKFTEEYSCQKI